MSKHSIREEKTCLNCQHTVDQKFCPNCGQENIETRKTFHHLFFHFFEDLTHYENAFWRTIRNLLFKPAALTKEYLSGKRLSYLAPVRLYIFVSFITFLFLAFFPINDDEHTEKAVPNKEKPNKKETPTQKEIEIEAFLNSHSLSLKDKQTIEGILSKSDKDYGNFSLADYKSLQDLDSIQKNSSDAKKLSPLKYSILKKVYQIKENNTIEEIKEKFSESFLHNFPKVLLIYMPIFALFLWLFQDKKRWYYFDHGIFTLHYFSFLLLINLLVFILQKILSLFNTFLYADFVSNTIYFMAYAWMFYYFFPAHHRFYEESRKITILKGLVLFFINMFFITVLLIAFFIYTFINLH
jgi:hypothetical protein